MAKLKGPERRILYWVFGLIFLFGLGWEASAQEEAERPLHPTALLEASSVSTDFTLTVGKSLLLSVPYTIGRMSVAEPDVADIATISRQEFILSGKTPGVTNLILWDEGDQRFVYNILVQADAEALAQGLKELYPEERLSVQAIRDNLVISGVTNRADVRETVGRIAESFAPKKVVNLVSAPGLAPRIPEGMRAVTVQMDEVIGVAGFLSPGSRVDVLATMEVPQRDGPPRTVSKTILQNVTVLTIGERTETSDGGERKVSIVTLLVSPEEAEGLTLGSTKGAIRLALRNDQDVTSTRTRGITATRLIRGRTTPAAPRPKTAPKPPPLEIEVIRGAERTIETVLESLKKTIEGGGDEAMEGGGSESTDVCGPSPTFWAQRAGLFAGRGPRAARFPLRGKQWCHRTPGDARQIHHH